MRRLATLVASCLLMFSLWGVASPKGAAAQDAGCGETYTRAQEAYARANFETAREALQTCLNRVTGDSARVRVFRLLSFVHLGRGDREAARLAVESLLDVRPAFAPDPSKDRPDFVALVREVKAARGLPPTEAREDRDRRWVRWVIGSVAAAAVATTITLLLRGSDGDSSDDANDDLDLRPVPQTPHRP
jgi:hypothetical protein